MKRITNTLSAFAAAVTFASAAFASPVPTSAVVHTRVFNDCPISILNVTNAFPGNIQISDQNQTQPFCVGFANMHTWRFSTDATNPIQFQNGDAFSYSAVVTLNGVGEGGLSLAPWFSPDTDGLFNVRTTDGEIAAFGGRLPFFSFTAAFGLVYTNNTPIQLGIQYIPNGLSAASPAQIVYTVRYNSTNYTSGLLNFDQGNVAEGALHGLWGALDPWYAGGQMKMLVNSIGQPHGLTGTWSDIQFSGAAQAVPEPATLLLVGAGLSLAARRRRERR